jgi:hypothetical protein
VEIFRSSRTSAERPTADVGVLAVAGHLFFLIPLFGALAVRVVGCTWSAGTVCHGEFGACLGEAGAGMNPEEVVDDEGPGRLFARWDGVEMVCVFVRGCAERR